MNKTRRYLFNMFSQMGLEDSPELTVKAEAVMFIRAQMDKKKLTQKVLAEQIGWTPSRLSDLLRGKLDLFSYDKINEALAPFSYVIHAYPKLERSKPAKATREAA